MATATPDITTDLIHRFDAALDHVNKAPSADHAKARLHQVYRLGVELKQRSDDLMVKLERGEQWLNANAAIGTDGNRNGSNHPKWQEREAQWRAWEAEYRSIEDALERGKGVL